MTIKSAELEELKQIYFNHYQIQLTDEQVLELGTRLVNLFKAIIKPIPIFDRQEPMAQSGIDSS